MKKLLLVEYIHHGYSPSRQVTSKLIVEVSKDVTDEKIEQIVETQWKEEYYMVEEYISCRIYNVTDEYKISEHFNAIVQNKL